MNEHWIVINTLVDCLENGINHDKIKFALLQLHSEVDRRVVGNLPAEEVLALARVLNRVNYDICNHE
jgi:hypothetical protein